MGLKKPSSALHCERTSKDLLHLKQKYIHKKFHIFITCGKGLLNEYASLAQGLEHWSSKPGSRVQISDEARILIFETK